MPSSMIRKRSPTSHSRHHRSPTFVTNIRHKQCFFVKHQSNLTVWTKYWEQSRSGHKIPSSISKLTSEWWESKFSLETLKIQFLLCLHHSVFLWQVVSSLSYELFFLRFSFRHQTSIKVKNNENFVYIIHKNITCNITWYF